MSRMISYEKLSKKERRRIDQKKRGTWYGVNPVTRRPENSKAYNRKKAQDWKKDSGTALFLCRRRGTAPSVQGAEGEGSPVK